MRINEIVTEGFVDDVKQGFEKGSSAMDRLLSPSKWFKKSDNTQSATTASKPKAPQQSVPRKNAEEVLSIVTSGGTLRNPEMRVLKQLYSDIKAGNASPRINSKVVLPVLQLVIKGKPLNDNQKTVLTQLKNLV
jgi:hypothetical protein